MRQKLFKKISLAALLAVLCLPVAPVSAAAAASLSLSTNTTGVVAKGDSVVVAVYATGGGVEINAVQADIQYPASLQYVGFSATGTAFEVAASNSVSDNVAHIARGTANSTSAKSLVGTITFRTLSSGSPAKISVATSSKLLAEGKPITYSPGDITLDLGGGTTSAPVATAPATAPTTATKITELTVKAAAPFSATISWKTATPSDSTVEYGFDTKYGLTASTAGVANTHAVTINSSFLAPLSTVHYRVKSVDADNNTVTSEDRTLRLPGVQVSVVVHDASGKPQAGAHVVIDSKSADTDSQGKATVASGIGAKIITLTYRGVTIQQPITVTAKTSTLPPYQLSLNKQPFDRWMVISAALLLLVVLLTILDAVLFRARRRRGPRQPAPQKPVPLAKPVEDVATHDEKVDPPPAEKPVAATPEPTLAPTPTPVPTPKAEVIDEPREDARVADEPDMGSYSAERVVQQLMEDDPAPQVSTVTARSVDQPVPIKVTAPDTLKITLEPLEPVPARTLPSAPELVSDTDGPAHVSAHAVAHRLKKPAQSHSEKTKPTSKKISIG